MAETRIGFVGLGLMGRPMSGHLIDAGYPLTVYDLDPAAIEAVTAKGAAAGTSPADVAAKSDIVVTMVPDSPDVAAVIGGDNGIAEGATAGSVVIDMSTISPAVGQEMAALLRQRGVDMLDAPVTGGVVGAENATLSILVGGDAAVFERCLPVLKLMGSNVTHMGPGGSGHTAKLANQVLGAATMAGIAEALVFARKAGLDLRRFYDAAITGAANSWALQNQTPKILDGDFAPGFMAKHMRKDLRIAVESASGVNSPMPITASIGQMYGALAASGRDSEGHHALIKVIEDLADAEARG